MILRAETGSYRDRDGRVFYGDAGEVFRGLSSEAWLQWQKIEASGCFQQFLRDGRVIPTERAPHLEQQQSSWAGYLRHERLPFVSYPFEWPFSLLKEGGQLLLDLLAESLQHDLTIKDGTIYNVQFRGVKPVFIDVGSFEALKPDRPWNGYRQFCQTALFPLMLQAYKDVPYHPWLRGRLDGITPAECWRLMSFRDVFRRGVLTHVWMHAWLQSSSGNDSTSRTQAATIPFDRKMLAKNFEQLSRLVSSLSWSSSGSNWIDYDQTHSYSAEDRNKKEQFVRRCVATRPWELVWDLGCNTGSFSRIAAENAATVIAMDVDHSCVDRLARQLMEENSSVGERILPLVSNVADQTAGLGWQGHERSSLLERGTPDLILSLALIHHLIIGHGIPLTELLEWFAKLRSHLIIEFVAPEDPMAQQLLQQRAGSCPDYTQSHFETELYRLFEVQDTLSLSHGRRTLYFARSRIT